MRRDQHDEDHRQGRHVQPDRRGQARSDLQGDGGHAPAVPGGFLVGIVSRADLLGVFDRPDEEIPAEIADDVIVGRFGMDPALVRVSVTDGVVILEGHPEPGELGYELADAIRHVRGVVAVRD